MQKIEKDGDIILTVDMVDILRVLSNQNKMLENLLTPGNYEDIEIFGIDEDGQRFLVENLEISVINPVLQKENFGE